jgi:ERF superfamily
MMSPEINELALALANAQAEFSAVPKGSVNPFFKSKYAGLPEVVAHTAPVLAKHGLAISQFIDGEYLGEDALVTYLIHRSGQFIAHTMKLHLPKNDSQGQGSATTYARRYAYMAALGLVADEDDDGNRASTPTAQRQSAPAPKPVAKSTGNEPKEVQDIIAAALLDPTDEFLTSLASQWQTKGSLSDKQLVAGKKRAYAVLKNNAPKNTAALLAEELGATEEEPF